MFHRRIISEAVLRRTMYHRHLMRSQAKTREAHHLAIFAIVHRHRREITRIANRRERAGLRERKARRGEGSRRYISYAGGERWDGETEAKANSLHCQGGVRRGLSLYFAFACLSWLGTCSLDHAGPTKHTRAFLCVCTPHCTYTNTNAYACTYARPYVAAYTLKRRAMLLQTLSYASRNDVQEVHINISSRMCIFLQPFKFFF